MNKLYDNKLRLLIVDDEEGFRRTIAKRLAKRGLKPVQASGGEECLGILKQNPMDVVKNPGNPFNRQCCRLGWN